MSGLRHVRWEGYDHRQLWDMIMDYGRAQPDDLFDRHYDWVRLGRRVVDINEAVQRQLNALFQSWQGTAALSAALSNSRLLDWSQETAEIAQRNGEELGRYANALVEARKRMPQPRHVTIENQFRAGEGATVWGGPEHMYTLAQVTSDHRATFTERAEAKERAVEVMRTFAAESADIKERLDDHRPAPQTAQQGPSYQPLPPPHEPDPWPDPPEDLPPGDPPASTPGAGADFGSGSGTGGYGAGAYGGMGGYGGAGGYGAGAGYGGAGAGHGADARGGGAGAAFGAATPRPGGFAGAPAEGAAGRAGAAGTAGSAARGGGMFYPPMMGAQRDEDREKRLAPYVVEDEDLFGDDRTVAPPVFGA